MDDGRARGHGQGDPRGASYSFRTVLAPMPGTERVTEYRPFTVTVPKTLNKTVAVTIRAPFAPEIWPPTSFSKLVATLDDHWRSDFIDNTLTFTTTNGRKYVRDTRMGSPTVVIADGKKVTFTLDAGTR